jgi:hypothetical protein
MEPLVKLANATGIAVPGLIHVNKSNSADPLNAVMGSRAFTAVARYVHFVAADPHDESVRLFGMPKNSLGPTNHETRTCVTNSKTIAIDGEDHKTAVLEWTGTDPRTIRQIFQEAHEMKQPTKKGDAVRWLLIYLQSHGSAVKRDDVLAAAQSAGAKRGLVAERHLKQTARHFFNWAIREGYATRTPFPSIDGVPLIRSKRRRGARVGSRTARKLGCSKRPSQTT